LRRLEDLDGIPKVKFATFKEFFAEADATSKKLMTWEGELYLEGHNGTFTSMGEHKFYNRYMELLLRDTEIFYYVAELIAKKRHSPSSTHEDIKQMWYIFLIDQFHDVLPGTCTKLTVDDTRKNFAELKEKCAIIFKNSIRALLGIESEFRIERIRPGFDAVTYDTKKEDLITFNSSVLDREDVLQVKDISDDGRISFHSHRSPHLGFAQLGLQQTTQKQLQMTASDNSESIIIENMFYIAKVCTQKGQILSLRDKRTKNF